MENDRNLRTDEKTLRADSRSAEDRTDKQKLIRDQQSPGSDNRSVKTDERNLRTESDHLDTDNKSTEHRTDSQNMKRNQQFSNADNNGVETDERNLRPQNENLESDNKAPEKGMLTGMFKDRESTEKAYDALHEKGYSKDEINMVMSKKTHDKYFSDDREETELGNKAAEGAGSGSAIGGTIGAVAGVIAAIGTSVVIPGLGLVVAGPIAAGLAGAGAGGLTGGIIGALVGWGIPKERAKIYESGIKDGHIVLGVKPKDEDDAKDIERAWNVNDGREIHR